MEIAYIAHTETCTLLLDADGVCRSVLAASSRAASNGGARPTRIPSSAERCIGAQYVATLDLREAGGMTAMPQPGAQMLFARTEKNGRITLIRSAPVIRFEAAPTKRVESGVHTRPEQTTVPYGEDDDLTIPCDAPTIQGRRSSLPPPRNSGVVPAAPPVCRASSPPSTASSRVPAASRPPSPVSSPPVCSPPVPPPPRTPRVESAADSVTRPRQSLPAAKQAPPTIRPTSPSLPRRPSVARASGTASEWDLETRPYKRASR